MNGHLKTDNDNNTVELQLEDIPLKMCRFNRGYHQYFKHMIEKVPGLYILLGTKTSYVKQPVYIGQTMNLYRRILEHDKKKDFWIECIMFIYTGDYPFTKDQVSYLEFISICTAAETANFDILENYQIPNTPIISESNKAFLNNIFDTIKAILQVFNITLFGRTTLVVGPVKSKKIITRIAKQFIAEQEALANTEINEYQDNEMDDPDDNTFHISGDDYDVIGTILPNGKILVEKGSYIRPLYREYSKKRMELLFIYQESTELDDNWTFTKDVLFNDIEQLKFIVTGEITDN